MWCSAYLVHFAVAHLDPTLLLAVATRGCAVCVIGLPVNGTPWLQVLVPDTSVFWFVWIMSYYMILLYNTR